ncbi:MAG: hypothetical protein B6I31_02400 [Desulfobacteraceae bacterium 4572_19]|nr:MAG: hypothetical protein B6I31_02400 [Desulfobacteraceae bacterium 4572_19]
MNDPIVSRARQTEEFMGQCDVIFLLSYCSQFLDVTDMRLLAQSIPSKGIRNIVLVGSLFDSVLCDEFEKYDSIGEAIGSLTEKKKNEAKTNFMNVKNQIKKQSLLEALDSAFPPVFISSMCYNISQHFNNMNSEERNTFENLNAMYDDFEFDANTLNSLANFEEIESKYEAIKNDKDKILSKRFSNILVGFTEGFSYEISLIKRNLILKRDKLKEDDIDSLTKKQKIIVNKMQDGRKKIEAVFEKHIIAAEKNFANLLIEIEKSAESTKRLKNTSRNETRYYKVSASRWFNPFSWGSTKTETEIITYTYANVHEAVEHIEDYVSESKKDLIKAVKEIVNIPKFSMDVTESIKGMFDFSDDNFDPDNILIPVENAVNRITIPAVQIDVDKHIEKIRDQFRSNEVRNDEVESLRREQARVVKLITNDIKIEVSATLEKNTTKLNQIKNNFIPTLTNDLEMMINELAKQIQHREEYLKKYDEIISIM